ncbi:hypothetical protein BDDG_11557 [Blastomyces dermatitidis ATCC 18188]|uniref:Uncharacterized protein n=1 Tax=Ajellomyces dermatitidis (strain ATCC 18188 / CBS 674.68) TaxID=653446 RepID=A0A0J9EMJ7_AJEDA|nr:hypothetical protein BDDG_11557 [Blastomyces dermatitidis ATCC 18188]
MENARHAGFSGANVWRMKAAPSQDVKRKGGRGWVEQRLFQGAAAACMVLHRVLISTSSRIWALNRPGMMIFRLTARKGVIEVEKQPDLKPLVAVVISIR